MQIKHFENIIPKDPYYDDGTVTTSCSNRLETPQIQLAIVHDLFPMDVSNFLPLEKCFMYFNFL